MTSPQSTSDQILIKIGEMQTTLAVIDERTRNFATDIGDHETRIRKLEAWRNAIPISTIMAMAGIGFGIWQAVK